MKKALIIILSIFLLIALAGFFAWRYQKSVARDLKTTGLLFENDTLYYSDIKITLFPATYTLLDFYYDSRDSVTQILFTAERLYASVDATSLMGGFESITIPSLEMERGKLVMKQLKSEEEKEDFEIEDVESVSINQFSIRDFSFSIAIEKSGYEFDIETFTTKIELTQKDGNIDFEVKPEDTECKMQNLALRDAFKHHDLTCGNFSFSRESGLEMVDFKIEPQQSRNRFDRFPMMEVRTDLKTPSIKIPGFTWRQDSVFHLHLPVVTLDSTLLNIYQNMELTIAPKPTKLPPSWFSNLGFVLQIDTVHLAQTRIEYEEKHDDDSPISKLHLTGDINAYNLGNHANRPEELEIDGKLLIMDGCPLEGQIVFNYNDPTDPFQFKGYIGKTDFTIFNPVIEKSWGILIKTGQCQKAEFIFWGNDHHSEGTLKIAYTDLYIKRADKESFFQRATDWALNAVALNSSSDYDEDYKIGVKREKNRSVVAFWWMSLESGLKDAIITPNKMVRRKIL